MALAEDAGLIDPATPNVVPSRYRQVAVAGVDSLDGDRLVEHFSGREVYMRTRFVVARHQGRVALVEVRRLPSEELFTRTCAAQVLAGPEDCVLVVDDGLDTAVPSQLALAAERVDGARCVIVEGAYSHVSFILNPAPLRIRLLDVEPPGPPKLVDQIERVLAMSEELAPVVVTADVKDIKELLAAARDPAPAEVLIACRASGMDFPDSQVSFLDQRPPRRPWTLLGCERSEQIHRWFYGEAPDRVDVCPRQWIDDAGDPVITRCCLIQEGMETRPHCRIVPWGASLTEVETALRDLVAEESVSWLAI